MPHQCVKCGKVFKDGSAELLKGCPECGGSRFFFTKRPLDEKERNIIDEINKDLTSRIIERLSDKKERSWDSIKPKDIRKMVEEELVEKKKELIIDEEKRKSIIEKIESEGQDSPETIDIEKPGKYIIDLKGLLEKEPIIIQKDGTYTIHLPSLFKMIER
jgi:hypothetical protein